ncbi:dual serine/threonine and tyrosine protein kinase-like [Limulus polyphemus]|uniref:Dual serine/threonine and tyrosine protein kinase n=1 Tax=Limulus polyphemus TaxID=6850 RepID=A0ABM1TIY1_LIMPO|nr:dual serine/threonine and tyrosine protein kinase-like [Limulus polyphemus]
MAANLPHEFNKFNKHCKYLKYLLKETRKSLEEIEKTGYFDNNQLLRVKLSTDDEEFVWKITEQPLGVVILGQNCWAKASVVNELFGQPLLPMLFPGQDNEEKLLSWRMVRFSYGSQTQITLALANSYELVDHLVDQPLNTVPRANLEVQVSKHQNEDPDLSAVVLQIHLRHALLRDDVQVVVSPSNHNNQFSHVYQKCCEGLTPIIIYCFKEDTITEQELDDLIALRKIAPKQPVFFVCSQPLPTCELTESEQHARSALSSTRSQFYQESELTPSKKGCSVFQQLCGLGYLYSVPIQSKRKRQKWCSEPYEVESELVVNVENFPSILLFTRHMLQSLLAKVSTLLNESHNRCLRMFILTAFDMTRDMMMTPKRLEYIRQREAELYTSLLTIANKKQEEIRQLIVSTVIGMRDELLEEAAIHQFQGLCLSEKRESLSLREIQICTVEIQNLVLNKLNSSVAAKLIGSVDCLRDSFVGTLERCLSSLEKAFCEDGESAQTSSALKQTLNAAYQVRPKQNSLITVLSCHFFQLVQTLFWKTPPAVDVDWKRKVAADMLDSLSDTRLARSICAQFRDRLKASHEQFLVSLQHLESLHSGRLQHTEEQRLKVKKMHAPKLARYALESTSLRDLILYGMPQIGREIGRGQYGVVYASESWHGFAPCALKSVVPPDEKHWNDLAMEFFYTRNIPEHDRIVQIRGSVIDYSYGGGNTPAVLLIMERLQRDLYSAIRSGLDITTRLQIALDVVQGIRFLHSQGLVHRDIKLKNVLLDKKNRAKITDLGFCKPEAMMSGSIVGTPIHMAPELFTGHYDNSVDVYAFGILFWYLRAGHVKLPYIFEQCQTKDQLWKCVRKGARPERLPQFDNESWQLIEECWSSDPIKRPLLGNVESRLMAIMDCHRSTSTANGHQDSHRRSLSYRRRHVARNYYAR